MAPVDRNALDSLMLESDACMFARCPAGDWAGGIG